MKWDVVEGQRPSETLQGYVVVIYDISIELSRFSQGSLYCCCSSCSCSYCDSCKARWSFSSESEVEGGSFLCLFDSSRTNPPGNRSNCCKSCVFKKIQQTIWVKHAATCPNKKGLETNWVKLALAIKTIPNDWHLRVLERAMWAKLRGQLKLGQDIKTL